MQLGTSTIPLLPAVAVGVAIVLAGLVLWGVYRVRRSSGAVARPARPDDQDEAEPGARDWTGEAASGAADPPRPPRALTVADAVAARVADTQPMAAVPQDVPTTAGAPIVAEPPPAPTASAPPRTPEPSAERAGSRPGPPPAAEATPPPRPARAGQHRLPEGDGPDSPEEDGAPTGDPGRTRRWTPRPAERLAADAGDPGGDVEASVPASESGPAPVTAAVPPGSVGAGSGEVGGSVPAAVSGPAPVTAAVPPGSVGAGSGEVGGSVPAAVSGPPPVTATAPPDPAGAGSDHVGGTVPAAKPGPRPATAAAPPDPAGAGSDDGPGGGSCGGSVSGEDDRVVPAALGPAGRAGLSGDPAGAGSGSPAPVASGSDRGPGGAVEEPPAPASEATTGSGQDVSPGDGVRGDIDVPSAPAGVGARDAVSDDDSSTAAEALEAPRAPEAPDDHPYGVVPDLDDDADAPDPVATGPVPPPWSPDRISTGAPDCAGSPEPVSLAVQQALAARAVQRARGRTDVPDLAADEVPDPVPDARDRLLSVLLTDPVTALGATTELDDTRARLDRLGDVLRRRRADFAAAVHRLHASGLTGEQIGELAGLDCDDVRQILEQPSGEGSAGR